MLVIGAIGRNGSGKDTLIDYLQQRCGIPKLSTGDVVRELAREEGRPLTREELGRVAEREMAAQGRGVFVRRLVEQIDAEDWETVGITGIRTPEDVAILRERYGGDFLLVHVEVADPRIRFERVAQRDEPRDPQSLEEFLEQDRHEADRFDLEQALAEADIRLSNAGTLAALHAQIERQVIERYLT
jgi:dephospho-CoA kinase